MDITSADPAGFYLDENFIRALDLWFRPFQNFPAKPRFFLHKG
jgi:hypothetical protein